MVRFRQHLLGIVLFPLTVIFVTLPLLVVFARYAESPSIPPGAGLALPFATSTVLALVYGTIASAAALAYARLVAAPLWRRARHQAAPRGNTAA